MTSGENYWGSSLRSFSSVIFFANGQNRVKNRRPCQGEVFKLVKLYFYLSITDAWTWWIVGLFGCPASYCMSCVCAPWTWGLFMCFCALFSPLNVEGVYNEPSLCCNCNYLTSNLPSSLCLLGEGLRGPPPCIIMVSKLEQLPYS